MNTENGNDFHLQLLLPSSAANSHFFHPPGSTLILLHDIQTQEVAKGPPAVLSWFLYKRGRLHIGGLHLSGHRL